MALGTNIGFHCHTHIGFAPLKNCPSSSKLPSLFIGQDHRRHHSKSIRLFAVPANARTPIPEAVESQSQYVHRLTPFSTSTTSTSWAEFAEKVSGEWDGHGADFSKGGEPIELPESVVPQAYRDWDVKVFDWQTQCPTLAHPTHFQLMYKLIRLLPTVGCEADAATRYSLLERSINLLRTANNSSLTAAPAPAALAYQSSGCFVAVWPKENGSRRSLMELEHCLIDPRDRESRVRIIQVLRIQQSPEADGDDQRKLINMQLEGIQVFCEQWYGPFRNGEQLGGCAIRDSAFASTPALKSSQVTGVWQGLPAIATFQQDFEEENTNIREIVVDDDSVPKSQSRDGSGLILLPRQLWCSSNQEEDGGTCFQVGWLLDQGLAITSKCSFSADAKLKEIAIACETAEVMISRPHKPQPPVDKA